jgi:hypothetical protein
MILKTFIAAFFAYLALAETHISVGFDPRYTRTLQANGWTSVGVQVICKTHPLGPARRSHRYHQHNIVPLKDVVKLTANDCPKDHWNAGLRFLDSFEIFLFRGNEARYCMDKGGPGARRKGNVWMDLVIPRCENFPPLNPIPLAPTTPIPFYKRSIQEDSEESTQFESNRDTLETTESEI